MGATKYPVLDKEFYPNMIVACFNEEQRGLITVLHLTGMNVSSLCSPGATNLIKHENITYITWTQPGSSQLHCAAVPPRNVQIVEKFLSMRRKTRQHYYNLVTQIGELAGYQDVSPMTFRQNYCLRFMVLGGQSVNQVTRKMGCSPHVAQRNLAKLKKSRQVKASGWRPVLMERSTSPLYSSKRKGILSRMLGRRW